MIRKSSGQQLTIFAIYFDGTSTPSRDECRTIVEHILREYVSGNQSIKLLFDDYGKPFVENNNRLSLSYAHSRKYLVIAISPSGENIGIDTEPSDRLDEILELKDSAFSSAELAGLIGADYVNHWCIKEAAVKRLGKGFRIADPSHISIKTNDKSYKLYLDDTEMQNGYFVSVILGENSIVICANESINNFQLHSRRLSDINVKE